MITLKELAEQSGMSVRTVSRVLKGEGRVAPEKVRLVNRLVKELNYTPNIAARNLRTSTSNFVGIISEVASYDIFVRKLRDLEERLEHCGFYPILGRLEETPEQFAKLLSDWNGMVKHIIVFALSDDSSVSPEILSLAQEGAFQFTFVDHPGTQNSNSLMIDRAGGVRDAVKFLLDSGRKRLLQCGSLENRIQGFRAAELRAREKGIDAEFFHVDGVGDFESGFALGARVMEIGADAVVFDTDRMALGFLKYAVMHRIRVPEEIALVGFDDDSAGQLSTPSLSTIAQPVEALNRRLVELLQRGDGEDCVRETFLTNFIRRQSV